MAEMGSNLKGQPSELHFTVTVTRKATGKVETYEMVGTLPPAVDYIEPEEKKGDDVGNP